MRKTIVKHLMGWILGLLVLHFVITGSPVPLIYVERLDGREAISLANNQLFGPSGSFMSPVLESIPRDKWLVRTMARGTVVRGSDWQGLVSIQIPGISPHIVDRRVCHLIPLILVLHPNRLSHTMPEEWRQIIGGFANDYHLEERNNESCISLRAYHLSNMLSMLMEENGIPAVARIPDDER